MGLARDGLDAVTIDQRHATRFAGRMQRTQQLERVDVTIHGRETAAHHVGADTRQTAAQLCRVQQLVRIITVEGFAQPAQARDEPALRVRVTKVGRRGEPGQRRAAPLGRCAQQVNGRGRGFVVAGPARP